MNRSEFLCLALVAALKRRAKLAFSTLGCPDWSMDKIISEAKRLGYEGIELRGLHNEIDLLKCVEFQDKGIDETLQKVHKAGLKIIDLGSSCNLHISEPAKRAEQLAHAKAYIDLAVKLSCPFIRVFPNNLPKDRPKTETLDLIVSGLHELSKYAHNKSVTILLETHGDVVWTEDLNYIMQKCPQKNLGLIWDFFNMWIVTKENPEQVFKTLKPFIKHVHVKDALISDKKFDYVAVGEGHGPVKQVLGILKAAQYKGYLSFEWEKKWHPEIADPEVVFPMFVQFIHSIS